MRRIIVVSAVLLCVSPARAAQDAAAWYRALESRDFIMDPPVGSDNDFFIKPGVPASLLWELDTSGSMASLPCDFQMKAGKQDGIPLCGTGTPESQLRSLSDPFFSNMGYPGYTGSATLQSDVTAGSHAFDPHVCATPDVDGAWSAKDGCLWPGVVYSSVSGLSGIPSMWRPFNGVGKESTSTIRDYCTWVENGVAANMTVCEAHLKTYGYYAKAARLIAGGTGTSYNNGTGWAAANDCADYFDCPTGNPTACTSAAVSCTTLPGAPIVSGGTCSAKAASGCSYQYDFRAAPMTVDAHPAFDLRDSDTVIATYCNDFQNDCGSNAQTVNARQNGATAGTCSRKKVSVWDEGDQKFKNKCRYSFSAITIPGNRYDNNNSWDSTNVCSGSFTCPAVCSTTPQACTPLAGVTGTCQARSGCTYQYNFKVANTTSYYPPYTTAACATPGSLGCGTTSKKYAPALTGDLLNFYPPKYVMLRQVVKQLVAENASTLRMGIMTYGGVKAQMLPDCAHFNPASSFATDYATNATALKTALDGLTFSGGTPLASTLAKACQYFAGSHAMKLNTAAIPLAGTDYGIAYDPPALIGASRPTSTPAKDQDSICLPCQKSFVVQVTDGMPTSDSAVPCRLKNWDGDCYEGYKNSQTAGVCSSPSTGTIPATNSACTSAMKRGGTAEDYDDDVAKFCYDSDLRPESLPGNYNAYYKTYAGKQNVNVSTVGFGLNPPLLVDAATKGGGQYASAWNADDLLTKMRALIRDIIKRATSFAVAPVSTVETKGSTYAYVPRFRPSAGTRWEGHMYRFKLFNEFAAGCTGADLWQPGQPALTSSQRSRNPNANNSCNDVYTRDANDAFIAEDADGVFRIYDTSVPETWVLGTTEATPVWDSGAQLQLRNDDDGTGRLVKTAVDSNGNGVFEPNEMIDFSVSRHTELAPYLDLGTRTGAFCKLLAEGSGQPGTPPLYASDDVCRLDFIRFVRGADVLDEDKDGNRYETRPKLMGDVFHSSPQLVTAPVPTGWCATGYLNQCMSSIYSDKLTPGGVAGYDAYVKKWEDRDQFILAGANDGMLHAFSAGTVVAGDDPETPYVTETKHYDFGTGAEKWAFIPPDMLPKLKRLILGARHELFVDGTAMVRDVWVDSSTNPGTKDGPSMTGLGEFHTVAVVGERQGGRHYFALDVTDPNAPAFRWISPVPGRPNSSDSLAMGETWNDFAPGAPPIVPVALADPTGPLTVAGDKAREVWAVILAGGYDTNMIRGRGIYMLDVYSGELLWRFARQDAGTDATDPRFHLSSVPGTVAALDLDLATSAGAGHDGLFDTAVFGDMLGQAWAVRFYTPGTVTESTSAEYKVTDKWFGGRSFVQFKGEDLSKRSPFFQLPSVVQMRDGGAPRVFLGGGDRRNILDKNGGKCSPGNLTACIRKQCSVDVKGTLDNIGPSFFTGGWKYAKTSSSLAVNAFDVDAAGPSSSATDNFVGAYSIDVDCHSPTPGGPTTPASAGIAHWTFGGTCDWGASTPGTNCPAAGVTEWPDAVAADVNAPVTHSRYYSFRLFDNAGRAPFTTLAEAKLYDSRAITDTDLKDAEATPFVPSVSDDAGWYVTHNSSGTTDEDTASGSGILGGCVLWNTLQPGTTPSLCGATGASNGYLYHADIISGSRQCGSLSDPAIARATVRASIIPPPAPTPVIAVNSAAGDVRYSMVSLEPGLPPQQTIVGQGGVLGPVQWIEVSRETHECRHGTGVCQ